MGAMPIDGTVTVVKGFDLFKNTLFLGINAGMSATFRILPPDYAINMPNAHGQPITDIEHAQINSKSFFFTSAQDGSIGTWFLSDSEPKTLQPHTMKQAGSPVTKIRLANPNFFVATLMNGNLWGWDLGSDSATTLSLGLGGISFALKHEGFLIVGDGQGQMQIR